MWWLVAYMFIVGASVVGAIGVALEASEVLVLRSTWWGWSLLVSVTLLSGGLFFAAVTLAIQQMIRLRQLLTFISLLQPDHLQEMVDRELESWAEVAGGESDGIIRLQREGLNAFTVVETFSNPDDARAAFQEANEAHQRNFRQAQKEFYSSYDLIQDIKDWAPLGVGLRGLTLLERSFKVYLKPKKNEEKVK